MLHDEFHLVLVGGRGEGGGGGGGGGPSCVEKKNYIAHAKLMPVPKRELESKIPNGEEKVEFLFL